MKLTNKTCTRSALLLTALSLPCLPSCHMPVATSVYIKAEDTKQAITQVQIELREDVLEEVLAKLRKCRTAFCHLDDAGKYTTFFRETRKYDISNRFTNLIYEIKIRRTIPSENIHSLINDVLTITEDQEKLVNLVVGYSKDDVEKIPIFTPANKKSAQNHYNKIKEEVIYNSNELVDNLVLIDQIID